MRPIAPDVALCVYLLASWSQPWAVLKRLNWSRSHMECGLTCNCIQGTMLSGGHGSPQKMANCRRIIRTIVQSGVLSIFSNLLNRWQQRFDLCCRYCNGWLHSCVSCLYIVLLVYYVSFLLYSHVCDILLHCGAATNVLGAECAIYDWVVDAVCDTDWRGEVRSGTTWPESTTSTVI